MNRNDGDVEDRSDWEITLHAVWPMALRYVAYTRIYEYQPH
jgi:hypothetical protein